MKNIDQMNAQLDYHDKNVLWQFSYLRKSYQYCRNLFKFSNDIKMTQYTLKYVIPVTSQRCRNTHFYIKSDKHKQKNT